MQAKNPFGDCGGNITDSENGYIKSPNFPEKYTTNDQSKSPMKQKPSNLSKRKRLSEIILECHPPTSLDFANNAIKS